jgi:hypothetical protein
MVLETMPFRALGPAMLRNCVAVKSNLDASLKVVIFVRE